MSPALLWLRRDLRLADNPAARAAGDRGGAVVPVFVWAPEEERPWAPGRAARWWLRHSLERLGADLRRRGSRLVLRRGPTAAALLALARETGARAVFWNRCYEPAVAARDRAVEAALRRGGLAVEHFPGALLFEPDALRTSAGRPFRVFTPFARACLARDPPAPPRPRPRRLRAPRRWPRSLAVGALGLRPPDGAAGLAGAWRPGEAGAAAGLRRLAGLVARYGERRDRPDLAATSRLSPHLHWGEVSPRQVWHAASRRRGAWPYLRQLLWREFAHHLLAAFPHTADEPLDPRFRRFPWRRDRRGLLAWRAGRTGYPLVDAGMRELRATGWLPNRVRMVAASFLVKDLLVPWQEGARWFWQALVDADLANNTLGWQWTAGCGADAAPFFRVFNPVGQALAFDPAGAYVRRWLPELARLPAPWIHRPWEAPPGLARASGVDPRGPYGRPIVDHADARRRALHAYARTRGRGDPEGGAPRPAPGRPG